jgi:hypothetical protein
MEGAATVVAVPGWETVTGTAGPLVLADFTGAVFPAGLLPAAGFPLAGLVATGAAGGADAAGTALSVAEPAEAAAGPLADDARDGTAIIATCAVVPVPGAAGGQDRVTDVTAVTCPVPAAAG